MEAASALADVLGVSLDFLFGGRKRRRTRKAA